MAQVTLKNVAGKDAGTVELDDATFAIQPNVPVMHQVVTAQLAARRAGTQNTKTRAEVRGGGAKPYRQKGTGNARQGSTRSPQFSGGGVALGPKPRKYNQKTPKKMISLALRSALSDRAGEGKVVVVDSWGWDTPSTKAAVKALAGLGIDGRVLVVVGRDDAAAALSFRNIPEVQLIAPAELNAYDVLCNDYILFTQDVLPTFEGRAKHAAVAADDQDAVVEDAVEEDAVEEDAVEEDAEADEAETDEAETDEAETDEAETDEAETDEAETDEAETDEAAVETELLDASEDEVEAAEGSASDEADGGSGQSEAEASPDHEEQS